MILTLFAVIKKKKRNTAHFPLLTIPVDLASLLCLSLTFRSFANKHFGCVRPCVFWLFLCLFSGYAMWRSVLLTCATRPERLWNTPKLFSLQRKTTRINLTWGYKERAGGCSTIKPLMWIISRSDSEASRWELWEADGSTVLRGLWSVSGCLGMWRMMTAHRQSMCVRKWDCGRLECVGEQLEVR